MFTVNPTFTVNSTHAESGTSQAKIKDLAEGCLQRKFYPSLKGISCEYLDGVLFLRGSLPTYYLKQLAQEVVGDLKGVERIDNQIRVVKPFVQ